MKKITLLSISLAFAGTVSICAQDTGTLTPLLPEGVTTSINDTRKATQLKNLVVAGEKAKGYKAFFAATDATHGEELWITDGTPAGTRLVKDINPGTGGSDISWLTRFNDKVVFGANDGTNGQELWISDGTEAGTVMVADIHVWSNSDPRGFTQVNETQFVFGAKDFDSENYNSTRGAQWWLYVSDGTQAGTKLIYQCDTKFPGQDNTSWVSPYCRVGRKVFFKADNKEGTVGEELWVTDGTEAGTVFVKDINTESIATGTANSAIDGMINFYNEKLFLKAFSIESSNEPWASDGTPEGTYQIFDSNDTFDDTGFPRGGGASDAGTFPYNGKVYFRGWSMEKGCELACTDLTLGNMTVFDINLNEPTNENHSYPDPGVEFDGVYMFCAATGFDATKPSNKGGELHYTDGTTVTMQSDLGAGTLCNWVKELTVASGSLYWWNEAGEIDVKQKLFRIDNKTQFPVRVTNLNPDGDRINTLRNLGGDLIFQTSNNKQLYCYHYRKDAYDPATETDNLDLEFRTRAEIAAGVPTLKTANTLVAYPNPAENVLNFAGVEGAKTIKIINLLGETLKTQISTGAVDVSALQSGVYFLQIENQSVRFIKK